MGRILWHFVCSSWQLVINGWWWQYQAGGQEPALNVFLPTLVAFVPTVVCNYLGDAVLLDKIFFDRNSQGIEKDNRPCLKRGPPSVGDAGNRRVVRAWAFSVTSRHVRFICSCAKLHRWYLILVKGFLCQYVHYCWQIPAQRILTADTAKSCQYVTDLR